MGKKIIRFVNNEIEKKVFFTIKIFAIKILIFNINNILTSSNISSGEKNINTLSVTEMNMK